MSIAADWNLKQKRLKEIIRKPNFYDEAKELFLSMHSQVHFSAASNTKELTIMDQLWQGMRPQDFTIMPTVKDVTIAWNIWHITRIEDLTMNILINNNTQVLNKEWLEQMKIHVTDTGNAMTDDEIMDFSKSIDCDALRKYRSAVGIQSKKVMSALEYNDMKRKIESNSVARILKEGGVINHPDSIWLLDFWEKKDVAGIILMPITRHQVVHLNDCFKLKSSISKKKDFYRS